MLLIIQTLNS